MPTQTSTETRGALVPDDIIQNADPKHKGGAMASIMARTRKRKGSLRKTALLGPGKGTSPVIHHTPPSPASPRAVVHGFTPQSVFVSVVKEKLSSAAQEENSCKAGETSTTDEDDPIAIPSAKTSPTPTNAAPLQSSPSDLMPADSYFPTAARRRPARNVPTNRSPLASLPPAFPLPPVEEVSYTTTATWGYVILISTWIIFVIGMGSCLEVWSWAWDVGETPYAPPELEDDPTLPIVGYYPALMVLTGVMAWVWCVGAWVGMKYFKHARMSGEGG